MNDGGGIGPSYNSREPRSPSHCVANVVGPGSRSRSARSAGTREARGQRRSRRCPRLCSPDGARSAQSGHAGADWTVPAFRLVQFHRSSSRELRSKKALWIVSPSAIVDVAKSPHPNPPIKSGLALSRKREREPAEVVAPTRVRRVGNGLQSRVPAEGAPHFGGRERRAGTQEPHVVLVSKILCFASLALESRVSFHSQELAALARDTAYNRSANGEAASPTLPPLPMPPVADDSATSLLRRT